MASLTQDRMSAVSGPPRSAGFGLALAVLALGALAMGLSSIFVRWASDDVGPFASAFWRVALALPVLFAWMAAERAPGPGRITRATALAGLAFAGDLFFWHLAILGTTVANATFFATTAPVFVVLATWLLLRGTIARTTVLGLASCLGGGAALVCESLAVAPGRLAGDLFGLATATFFATYLLFTARARAEGVGAARVTFWSTAVTALVLLVAALALDGARFWPQRAETWVILGALALVSQVAGQGLLAVALGRLPAVFSSLVIFLEAVFAAAAGWLVLGERVSAVQAGGGALILVGIWIARPRRAVPGFAA